MFFGNLLSFILLVLSILGSNNLLLGRVWPSIVWLKKCYNKLSDANAVLASADFSIELTFCALSVNFASLFLVNYPI